MPADQEASDEYRIAYQQWKRATKEYGAIVARAEQDLKLAEKRYEVAREAYVTLALGEDDEFLALED